MIDGVAGVDLRSAVSSVGLKLLNELGHDVYLPFPYPSAVCLEALMLKIEPGEVGRQHQSRESNQG